MEEIQFEIGDKVTVIDVRGMGIYDDDIIEGETVGTVVDLYDAGVYINFPHMDEYDKWAFLTETVTLVNQFKIGDKVTVVDKRAMCVRDDNIIEGETIGIVVNVRSSNSLEIQFPHQEDSRSWAWNPNRVTLAYSDTLTQTTSPINENPDAFHAQVGGDHYKSMKIQPTEYITANELGWCEGNVVKYISRHATKGGIEDLKKVKHYVDLLIELEYS